MVYLNSTVSIITLNINVHPDSKADILGLDKQTKAYSYAIYKKYIINIKMYFK